MNFQDESWNSLLKDTILRHRLWSENKLRLILSLKEEYLNMALNNGKYMGIGIALGIAIGAALGIALKNLSVWIGLGVVTGFETIRLL